MAMKRRKLIILIASIAMFLIIAGATTTIIYAAYINSHSAQRVIAAYETDDQKFSSNYLQRGQAKDNLKTVYASTKSTPASAGVTICNYPQENPAQISDAEITYTLTAKLVKLVNSEFVDATAGDVGSHTVEINNQVETTTLSSAVLSKTYSNVTLEGGTLSYKYYTITFSTSFLNQESLPNLYLELDATPSGSLVPIRGILLPDVRAASAEVGWRGTFTDSDANSPRVYSGFNYNVSGIGSGVFKLIWDSNYIDISQLSILELTKDRSPLTYANVNTDTDLHYIEFDVNSASTSSYQIQFYKTNSFDNSISWPTLKGYVTYVYTKS